MRNILLIGALASSSPAWSKDGPTYYTPERIAAARQNIEKHGWAKDTHRQILEGQGFKYYTGLPYGPADTYTEMGDEFMWMLMPPTTIGRHVEKKYKAQSPGHTTELRAKDPWCGFTIDPINHPYKVRCRVTGTWYPTNDYHLGDMTSGDYPDEGEGCRRDGTIYYFLREYAHMCYGSAVVPALSSLSQAWAITGDRRYGRAGCILLARLAMEYPNYDDRADRLYYAKFPDVRDPDVGWKMGGMVTDLIWETGQLASTALAYDGLYTYMDRDPDMLAFLRSKGVPIETGGDLRRYVEDHILRVGIDALYRGNIHGNPGMHERAAAAVALVLDDYDDSPDSPFNSKRAVDYVMRYQHAQWSHVAHDAMVMINGTDRSGGGHESPNYACSRFDMVKVNQYLDQIRSRRPDLFPAGRYPDLFQMPKIDRIYDYYLKCSVHGYFTPSIGDCGGISSPARVGPVAWAPLPDNYKINYLYAFRKYGDPRYARACADIDSGELASGDLFDAFPEEQLAEAIARPDSKIEWTSRLLDGYGLAILDNSSNPKHRRAVSLNYTNLQGHAQCDALTIQLFARGVSLLPDLGYPVGWEHRYTFDSNSLAHNTVTVDETQPILNPTGGRARLFGRRDGVHVVSATHNPYPEGRKTLGAEESKLTDLYQRTVVLVDIDEERFYVVDHFAVNGGEQHDQSWHGLLVPPEAPEVEWTGRPGTLAGRDVPQFGTWTDRWGRDRKDFPAYLTDIRVAEVREPATWTWRSGLPEGDTLALHLLPVGGAMKLYMGRSRTPARPADWALHYVIARREVKDGLPSQFVSVLDAYQDDPVVKAARIVSEEPVVVEATHATGKDTIELNVPLGAASNHTGPLDMGVRVTSARGDVRFGTCTEGPGFGSSVIDQVDYARDRVALAWSREAEADFVPGAALRIYNAGRSAVFHVTASERNDDKLWLTLTETALFARGRVVDVGDGQLMVEAYLTFADGTLEHNTFDGAWLGDERSTELVRGASHQDRRNIIYLAEPVPAAALRERYLGQMASVWQYGPGDRVETARVSTTR